MYLIFVLRDTSRCIDVVQEEYHRLLIGVSYERRLTPSIAIGCLNSIVIWLLPSCGIYLWTSLSVAPSPSGSFHSPLHLIKIPKIMNPLDSPRRSQRLQRLGANEKLAKSEPPMHPSPGSIVSSSQALPPISSSSKSATSRKRRRTEAVGPPRRSRRLNLIIEGALPPEIIHDIVERILVDFIDEMLTARPAWNAVVALRAINFQYRAITTKILSEVLGVDCR